MTSNTQSQNVINFVRRRKANLIKLFHGRCCICGFDAFQEALEFHHLNPDEKEFNITGQAATKALKTQIEEVKKCILVCSNCHRGIHAEKIIPPQNPMQFFDTEVEKELLQDLYSKTIKQKQYCKNCNKEITIGSNYCLECYPKFQQKVERPTREELKFLIRENSFVSIGKKYGVSDNAIRKWCRAVNLPTKKKDIESYSIEEWEKI